MAVTDYHALVRDEVKQVVESLALGPPVHAIEDLDDIGSKVSIPCIVVVPVGPEQERTEFTTNIQTGLGWPVLIAHYTSGVTSGEKSPGSVTATAFRRALHVAFDRQRALSGSSDTHVANSVCEVSFDAALFDKDAPSFQKLQTYLTVVAVGRFPRS